MPGRTADVLSFSTDRGERVSIPALALEVDHVAGVELFEIVQTARTNLRLRLRFAPGADADRVWEAALGAIKRVLAAHKLDQVTVERAEEPPQPSSGGKYRTTIPIRLTRPASRGVRSRSRLQRR